MAIHARHWSDVYIIGPGLARRQSTWSSDKSMKNPTALTDVACNIEVQPSLESYSYHAPIDLEVG